MLCLQIDKNLLEWLSLRPSEKLEETRVDRKVDDGLDDPTLLVALAKSGPFISNREQSELPTPFVSFCLSSTLTLATG